MIKIVYEKNGKEYDHLSFKIKNIASKWITMLEKEGCYIKEINDDKSERDEEVDRKSRRVR